MNYRHIYHAGNFADVFKHIIVARIIDYLKRKEQAFRVIDTHSGIGLYDLSAPEPQKTGEWHDGVGKFFGQDLPHPVQNILAPWLSAVSAVNPDGNFTLYPGSPLIIRHLLRKQDRLTAIELHPHDVKTLKQHFIGDYQSRILHLDGWLSLGAHVPPKEKRGLVLVDPPFEESGEFSRLVNGLIKAHKRFSGGTYALWYPIKHYDQVNDFIQALKTTQIPKMLRLELHIRGKTSVAQMNGCGMIVVNPPYILQDELKTITPTLIEKLCEKDHGKIINEWINGS